MARSFVQGGPAATGLATGVPYIRRIIRNRSQAAMTLRHDNLTAAIAGHRADVALDGQAFPAFNQGSILNYNGWFKTDDGFVHTHPNAAGEFSNVVNSARNSRAWNLDNGILTFPWLREYTFPGEMLHIEFPATARTFSVQFEATNYDTTMPAGPANREHRVRVMLTAPGQKVKQLDAFGNVLLDASGNEVSQFMDPHNKGNYIEITEGETATFNVRTSHFFMFITTWDTNNIFDDDLSGDLEDFDPQRSNDDSVALLVTAILDHEGLGNGRGTATKVIGADGQEKEPIKKIYPQSTNNTEGVG